MKKTLLSLMLLSSLSCLAADYHVPPGSYTGTGTWHDNLGASGTWSQTLEIIQDASGLHYKSDAKFDDGRTFTGTADIVFSSDSNYTYVANVDGSSVTIGQGVSAPGRYQIFNLLLDQDDTIVEFGDFSKPGSLKREGTILNQQSGRSTLYEVTQHLQQQ